MKSCKTGVRISYRGKAVFEEWRCPHCFHRWNERADNETPPEVCPVCSADLEAVED